VTSLSEILITAPWFTKECLERLKERFSVTTNILKRWFTEHELIDIIAHYDAVIAGSDPFTAAVVEKADKLKIIARRGIGYDNIDLAACKRRQILVTYAPIPEEHQAVAEFTVALMLDLTKNITRSNNSLRKGSWEREAFRGANIKGKTVGIVGLGHIGRIVARTISAFGANVIYHDPYVSCSEFKAVDLLELFSAADIVSVHVPKTNETEHLITSKLLGRMKPGSFFVNTSRSTAVVHDDLLMAIRSRRIAAAAIDVFDQEPPLHEPLLGLDNVVTTPHIAGLTSEAFSAIDNLCVNNVIKALEGKGKLEFILDS